MSPEDPETTGFDVVLLGGFSWGWGGERRQCSVPPGMHLNLPQGAVTNSARRSGKGVMGTPGDTGLPQCLPDSPCSAVFEFSATVMLHLCTQKGEGALPAGLCVCVHTCVRVHVGRCGAGGKGWDSHRQQAHQGSTEVVPADCGAGRGPGPPAAGRVRVAHARGGGGHHFLRAAGRNHDWG